MAHSAKRTMLLIPFGPLLTGGEKKKKEKRINLDPAAAVSLCCDTFLWKPYQ